MNNQDTALAVVQAAFQDGATAAERQLALIGREQGDEALALISRELSPAEVFALAKDGDLTKSSLAQAFVTPEQLCEAFDYFGSQYKEPRSDIARDLLDFLYPFLFEGLVERHREMMAGFLAHRLARRVLIALCLEDIDPVGFFSANVIAEQVEHGWKEILLLVKEVSPETFTEVRKTVLELYPNKEKSSRARLFSERVCESLIAQAREKVGDHGDEEKPGETFVGI